jgi:hypothetical protein
MLLPDCPIQAVWDGDDEEGPGGMYLKLTSIRTRGLSALTDRVMRTLAAPIEDLKAGHRETLARREEHEEMSQSPTSLGASRDDLIAKVNLIRDQQRQDREWQRQQSEEDAKRIASINRQKLFLETYLEKSSPVSHLWQVLFLLTLVPSANSLRSAAG